MLNFFLLFAFPLTPFLSMQLSLAPSFSSVSILVSSPLVVPFLSPFTWPLVAPFLLPLALPFFSNSLKFSSSACSTSSAIFSASSSVGFGPSISELSSSSSVSGTILLIGRFKENINRNRVFNRKVGRLRLEAMNKIMPTIEGKITYLLLIHCQ